MSALGISALDRHVKLSCGHHIILQRLIYTETGGRSALGNPRADFSGFLYFSCLICDRNPEVEGFDHRILLKEVTYLEAQTRMWHLKGIPPQNPIDYVKSKGRLPEPFYIRKNEYFITCIKDALESELFNPPHWLCLERECPSATEHDNLFIWTTQYIGCYDSVLKSINQ